jgi:hypothetical protein
MKKIRKSSDSKLLQQRLSALYFEGYIIIKGIL